MLNLCLLTTCTWNTYKVIHWVLIWPCCLFTGQHIKCLHSAASLNGCCLPYRLPGNTYCSHTAILKDFAAPFYKWRYVLSTLSTFTWCSRFCIDSRLLQDTNCANKLFGKASWPDQRPAKLESNLGVVFQRWNQSRAQKVFRTDATWAVYYSQTSMNSKCINVSWSVYRCRLLLSK